MRLHSLVASSVVCLVACVVGCGTSASERYAGLHEVSPTTGEYVLRYLSPPWKLGAHEGTAAHLYIPATGGDLTSDAALIAVPKYLLDVDVVATDAMTTINADAASASSRGEVALTMARPITTDTGDMGFDLVTRRELPMPRYFRYVALGGLSSGRAVHLVFEANPNLDEPEVTRMIRQLDVAPMVTP